MSTLKRRGRPRPSRQLAPSTGLAKFAHVAGDFLEVARFLRPGGYDAVLSWLTILHIADRPAGVRAGSELLTPGGVFYAADFCQADAGAPLTAGMVRYSSSSWCQGRAHTRQPQ